MEKIGEAAVRAFTLALVVFCFLASATLQMRKIGRSVILNAPMIAPDMQRDIIGRKNIALRMKTAAQKEILSPSTRDVSLYAGPKPGCGRRR